MAKQSQNVAYPLAYTLNACISMDRHHRRPRRLNFLSSARKASIATSCPRSARPLVDNPSFRSFPPLSSQQFLVAEYGDPRAFGGTCDEKKTRRRRQQSLEALTIQTFLGKKMAKQGWQSQRVTKRVQIRPGRKDQGVIESIVSHPRRGLDTRRMVLLSSRCSSVPVSRVVSC